MKHSNSRSFEDLGLLSSLLHTLQNEGYTAPTPIQARAIPLLLHGRDILGVAQTGTGKTAAFALPILQRLSESNARPGPRAARALILAPTRELVIQIADSFAVYGAKLRLKCTAIVGGVAQGLQRKAMASGTDVLVATPGRLIDLVEQRQIRLDRVQILVVDEADRMLDMGFIRDVRNIVARLPKSRQSLMFSATMPSDVGALARDMLDNPEHIEVTPETVAVDRIHQRVIHVTAAKKVNVLSDLLSSPELKRVIVFTRTKHRANRVADRLDRSGVSADALHGNKSQSARQKALERFRVGAARVLVATDIAARGIDVDDISHVINFELPNEPESYVHRIGRTARAGASGHAITLCDPSEFGELRRIERLIGQQLVVDVSSESSGSGQPAGVPAERPKRAAVRPKDAAQRASAPAGRSSARGRNRPRRRRRAAA